MATNIKRLARRRRLYDEVVITRLPKASPSTVAALWESKARMTKTMHALGAASILALMAAAGPAQAQGVTAKDILSHYNLVTTGNVSTRSDIVGNTVVGGDLNGATFFGGGGNVPATPALYLYGKLNDSLNLNAGGSLYYAGGSSPKVNYNGGGKHFTT
jgi:hypothetical protein